MADGLWTKRKLGRTGINVTPIGLGGAWLGYHGDGIDQDVAVATVSRALEMGINLIDTSGAYQGGRSEVSIGIALQQWYKMGGKREDLILSTKTGTRTRPHDYTAEGTRSSIEQSLAVLQTDYLDIALIHDPEDLRPVLAPGQAWDVLKNYKRRGIIRAIGLGVRNQAFHRRMIRTGECDVCLTHSDFHLLNQSAVRGVLEPASAFNVGVFNGSSLAMGLLSGDNPQDVIARWQERGRQYRQQHAETRTFLEKLKGWQRRMRYAGYRRRMEAMFKQAQALWGWSQVSGIDLLALNLQYCLRDPRVTANLMGASTPEQIEADVNAFQTEIPASAWEALVGFGIPLSKNGSQPTA